MNDIIITIFLENVPILKVWDGINGFGELYEKIYIDGNVIINDSLPDRM